MHASVDEGGSEEMRDILFRGKRKGKAEWVEGFYDKCERYGHCIHVLDCPASFTVDPDTVGQYVGQPDKNGKKIFEGDILKDSYGWIFKVIWDDDNARFLGWQKKPHGDTYICYVDREPKTEVIGNIYDNPELLEAQK